VADGVLLGSFYTAQPQQRAVAVRLRWGLKAHQQSQGDGCRVKRDQFLEAWLPLILFRLLLCLYPII